MPTNFHTWGCPVFILDAPNQSGTIGTAKWNPKAHTGIYLGSSPCHAGSVALVLNLKTGLVSPQFHVVYDDNFTTVSCLSSADPPPSCLNILKHSTESATDEETQLAYAWLHPDDTNHTNNSPSVTFHPNVTTEPSPLPPKEQPLSPPSNKPSIKTNNHRVTSSKGAGEEERSNTFLDINTMGLRRSPRIAALPPRRAKYGLLATVMLAASNSYSTAVETVTHCFQARVVAYNDYLNHNFDGTPNHLNPLAHIYASTPFK